MVEIAFKVSVQVENAVKIALQVNVEIKTEENEIEIEKSIPFEFQIAGGVVLYAETEKSRARIENVGIAVFQVESRAVRENLSVFYHDPETNRYFACRSPSPGRGRFSEVERQRKDEGDNRKLNACGERGRRIETIVQSGANVLDSEMGGISSSLDGSVASFQYSNELEGRNEYYYTENNLTYPPCMDESATSSPKRLSLDDR